MNMARTVAAGAVCLLAGVVGMPRTALGGLLPEGYQEVAWIESTGLQCINLGFAPDKTKTGVVMTFNSGTYVNQTAFFGTAWGNDRYLFDQRDGKYMFHGNGSTIASVREHCDMTLTIVPDGTGSGVVTLDNPDGSASVSFSLSYSGNLQVFGIGTSRRTSFRLYRFLVTERRVTTDGDGAEVVTHVPVRDFTPCRRNIDGEIGLYDALSADPSTAFVSDVNRAETKFGCGEPVYHADRLDVRSEPFEVGAVSPAYGIYGDHVAGVSYTLTSPATWTSDDGLSRATCVGCTVTADGETIASETFSGAGETRSITYEHPDGRNGARAVWRWAVEHRVTAAAGAGGTVSPAVQWAAHGSMAVVTATANEKFGLFRWTGTPAWANPTARILRFKAEAPVDVAASFGPVYYVAPTGDDGTADGSDPLTPYKSIQGAVDAVPEGAVVSVAANTYVLDAQIAVSKGIRLQGAGREATVLTRNAAKTIRILTLGNADAIVCDMTLSDGYCGNANGGNVYVTANGGLIANCVIRNGKTGTQNYGGGGIAMLAGSLSHCIVSNNVSQPGDRDYVGGGGLYVSSDSKNAEEVINVDNCLFYANNGRVASIYGNVERGMGAVAMCGKGTLNLSRCTFVRNVGTVSGGIYRYDGRLNVAKCVFAENDGWAYPIGRPLTDIRGTLTSCKDSLSVHFINPDCLAAAADFEDPVAGDWRIKRAAVGYGIGYADVPDSDEIDCALTVDRTEALPPFAFAFRGRAVGADKVVYSWNFGDGSDVATGASVSHVYAKPGVYTVAVTATDADNAQRTRTRTYVNLIKAVPSVLYCKPTNDKSAAPYDSWDNAATNIQDAIDFASTNRCTIRLAKGAYGVQDDYGLYVRKPLVIEGPSGDPNDAVIRPSVKLPVETTGRQRVFRLNHADAIVRNLTLSDGYFYLQKNSFMGDSGINLLLDEGGGTVSNVISRNAYGWGCRTGGAGALVLGGLMTHCVLTNNYIYNDRDPNYHGTLQIGGGTVRNSLIANNRGGSGANYPSVNVAGVYISGGTLESCTIAGNSSTSYGGLWCKGGTTRNCIVQKNTSTAKVGLEAQIRHESGTLVNTLTDEEITSGKDNRKAKLPVADQLAGDWHPTYGSESIGAAAVQTWMTGATDLDGTPMLSAEGKADVGCWQYVAKGLDGFVSATETVGVTPFQVTFQVEVAGGEGPISYVWDFGEGDPVETAVPTVAYTFRTLGQHAVTVTVTDSSATPKTSTFKLSDPVTVSPAVIYVTTKANVNASAPYATEETAATNVVDAMNVAGEKSQVVLLPGTHVLTNQLAVMKGVTLRSKSGRPEDTEIIRPTDAKTNYRVLYVNHEDALVCNLAVSGGYVTSNGSLGGNIYMDTRGGTISNCVVRNGTLTGQQTDGSGVCIKGGDVTHCVFSNNYSKVTADNYSGGTIQIVNPNSKVEFCLLVGNRSEANKGSTVNVGGVLFRDGGILRNCTVVGNSGGAGVGGIRYYGGTPTIENCIIADNTTTGELSGEANWDVCSAATLKYMNNCATERDVGASSANGNVFGDLAFRRPERNDWRVRRTSVAVRKGKPDSIRGATYLNGLPVPTRGAADIGAYGCALSGLSVFVR